MENKDLNSDLRTKVLYLLIVSIFFFLGFRLYQIQIIENETYSKLSKKNAIKEKILDPFRGVFYDRNMNLLVDNEPSYTLRIFPKEFDKELIPILENYFKLEPNSIANKLKQNQIFSPYIPLKILRGLNFEQISWLEENAKNLKGVDYSIDMERTYPFGVRGSHIFGYCKEISDKKLKENLGIYLPGDFVGHSGLEKYYEEYLRGQKGKNLVYVDSRGREVARVNDGEDDTPAKMGYHLVLSIDGKLQKKAEELLKGRSGSIVALDPSNGEVLCMASAPDFDLKNFASFTPQQIWAELTSDKKKPLFNRATSSIYPPGSTFKMMSAAAALQEGYITPSTLINCPGAFVYGNRSFKCHGAHGGIDVVHAIEKSCNTFFYQLILKQGFNNWSKYGSMFGFGKKTGIDIYEENAGIMPSEEYYDRVYGKGKWTQGYIVSLGIGQGEVGVSPLQLAIYTSILANGGIKYTPHTVKKFFNPVTKEEIFPKVNSEKLPIKPEVIQLIREGMNLVVNGNGTATVCRIPGIQVAGKTGTAQNPHGNDHAWFIAFAPYENPKIALCVIIENAGFGGAVAAPLAKILIESYLKGNYDFKEIASVDSSNAR